MSRNEQEMTGKEQRMSSNGQLDCSRGRPDSEVNRGPVSRNEQEFPANPSLRRRAAASTRRGWTGSPRTTAPILPILSIDVDSPLYSRVP